MLAERKKIILLLGLMTILWVGISGALAAVLVGLALAGKMSWYPFAALLLALVVALMAALAFRRLVIQKLLYSEHRYRTLFNNTADAVLLLRDSTILEANERAALVLGCKRTDLPGRDLLDFSPQEQGNGRLSRIVFAQKLNLEGGQGRRVFDWRYLRHRSIREAEISAQRISIDGKAASLLTMRDVTDQREAERELRESEEHYRAIFERSSNLFLLYRGDGELVDANQAACRMFNCTLDELKKRPLVKRISNRDTADKYLMLIADTISAQHSNFIEITMCDHAGEEVFLEIYLDPFVLRDEPLCLATCINVTAWKQATRLVKQDEQRLEALLRLQQMVEPKEKDLCRFLLECCRELSASRRGVLGVAKRDGTLCICCSDYIADAWSERLLAELPMEPVWCNSPSAMDIPHPEGVKRILLVPLVAEQQKVLFAMVADKDGDYDRGDARQLGLLLQGAWQRLQRLRAVADLRRAKIEAERANQAKSDFLAVVSHELRTPMTVIMASLQQTMEHANAEQGRYLDMANDAAHSLLELVNDILDFSKLEAEKLELELLPFCVRDLVDPVVRTFSLSAEEKKIQIKTSIAADIPPVLLGDQYRLRQVLLNLVGNAVKFTERGSVEIALQPVALQHKEGIDTCLLQIAVRDTGIGIEGIDSERLFEGFSQADSSTTRKYGGTGLGLAICKGIVLRMHGTIAAYPRTEGGSEFVIEVPLEVVAGAHQETQEAPGFTPENNRAKVSVTLPASGKQILIVEDDMRSAALFRAILQETGARVTDVLSGYEAIQACREGRFALILVDYQMPGIDGAETIRRIRAEEQPGHKNMLLVGLTAGADPAVQEQMLAAGADICLAKPVRRQDLYDVVARI